MVVTQVNPYHALIIRCVLGAVAAMVDAVLGAVDVALTEALMGTMLAITLYAVAVRSSTVMCLGVIQDESTEAQDEDYHRRHQSRFGFLGCGVDFYSLSGVVVERIYQDRVCLS